MNSQYASPRRQRGSFVVIVALSLVTLIGMTGLALDLGNAFVNKTRLQNMVDAMALSAAVTMASTEDATLKCTDAIAHGQATGDAFINGAGNAPLRVTSVIDVSDATNVTFEFAQTLASGSFQADCTGITPNFVRVRKLGMDVPELFGRVLGNNNLTVSATAVAGIVPITINCSLPVLVCAGPNPGSPVDTNCSDGMCYGLSTAKPYVLKEGSNVCTEFAALTQNVGQSPVGSGNFQLVDVGSGGSDIADAFSGRACPTVNNPVITDPGNKVGPTDNINSRFFVQCTGSTCNPPPDKVTTSVQSQLLNLYNSICAGGTLPTSIPLTYSSYYSIYENPVNTNDNTSDDTWNNPNGAAYRRIAPVNIVNCSSATNVGGKTAYSLIGQACFFLSEPAVHSGNDNFVFGELLYDCPGTGAQSGTNYGPYKIILYKDPDGVDA